MHVVTTHYSRASARPEGPPLPRGEQRNELVQFRISPSERAQLKDAASRRGFLDGDGKPNVSGYLRAIVKADCAAMDGPMDTRSPASNPAPARPAPPPLAPAATEALRSILAQVTGACSNLNQLVRDVHLEKRGSRPSAEVSGLRIEGVLVAIERDVLGPLSHLLGRRPAKPVTSSISTDRPPEPSAAVAAPAPEGAVTSTAERFRRTGGPSPKPQRDYVRRPPHR